MFYFIWFGVTLSIIAVIALFIWISEYFDIGADVLFLILVFILVFIGLTYGITDIIMDTLWTG